MRKTSISFVCLLLVVVFALSACSNNSGNNEGTNNQPTSTTSNSSGNGNNMNGSDTDSADKPSYYMEEPTEITMLVRDNPSWPYKEDWPIWEWYKDETNITVDVTTPAGNFDDALNLAVASGSLQDVIPNLSVGWSNMLGQQGALMELNQYMDKLPNVQKFRDEHPEKFDMYQTPEGELYFIPSTGSNITDIMVWFYRQDILEKNNLELPTNWDELYDVSKELKAIYPESYPLLIRSFSRLNMLALTFDAYNTFYYNPDQKKAVYGPTEDNYKDLVTTLHKFYEDELIPPNFLSMDGEGWQQYLSTDKGFFTYNYIGQKEIMNKAMAGEGNYWLEYMSPPDSKNAEGVIVDGNYSDSGFAVNSQTKHLDAVLSYIDFLYSDKGMELSSWGKEGETFEMANGEKKYMDAFSQFTDLRKNVGIMTTPTFMRFDTDALLSSIDEKERVAYNKALEDIAPNRLDATPTFTPEEQELYTQYYASLSTYQEENISKFILGEKSLDEWDDYVAGYSDYHLDKLLEVYDAAFKRLYH